MGAQFFFDMLVKMTVLGEINVIIKGRFLGMQTVSKYFEFLELTPPPSPTPPKNLSNLTGAEILNLCTSVNKNDWKWYILNFQVSLFMHFSC
jgi:hypothetical protein